MDNLKQYEEAIVNYYSTLQIASLPLCSSNFHYEFAGALKESFRDSATLQAIANKYNWALSSDWSLNATTENEVIIVTDTKLKIVFASHNLEKMNGYKVHEVLGNSPKMFQGPVTDNQVTSEINAAIQSKQSFHKTIFNYKKNGALYACEIKGFPIFNSKGLLSHYIAFEKAA